MSQDNDQNQNQNRIDELQAQIDALENQSTLKVMFINNDGGGFADFILVPEGSTIKGLFAQQMAGDPEDYLIRVNRQPTTAEYVIREGDRVSITPVKVEGA